MKPEQPYAEQYGLWEDDIHVATRLGERQTLLRLACWQDGHLRPWCGGEDWFAWRLSEVSVLRRWVASEAVPDDPALVAAIEDARRQWRGHGDEALLMPLVADSGGDAWTAQALDGQGARVTLRYDPMMGLSIIR